jgi:N-methylhydantoinase A
MTEEAAPTGSDDGLVIAVDIGGTFTDVVTQDLRTMEIAHRKVSTTTGAPADGIARGVREALAAHSGRPPAEAGDGKPARVARFLHGTTIATNALIEGKGVRSGLLLSAGLRGIAQLQAGSVSERGNPRGLRPRSLVSEQDVFEIPERVDRAGAVIAELDEDAVRAAARELARRGINSAGICFLFSFLHPEHERRAKEVFLEEHPDCTVLCAVDVLPRVREWPRCSTLLLSSYLEPIMVSYIGQLRQALTTMHIADSSQFIMESNGGMMSFGAVIRGGRSIYTLLSGPAAAVQAAQRVAEATGLRNLVTLDIGGTSCDVAFIEGGTALEITATQVCGYDLYVPMLDITTIGAGGGTIAEVNEAGRLVVGPGSAGAVPGPAAYGRGGARATVSDADLVLGFLNPAGVIGGDVTLSPELARKAIAETVAQPLGMSVESAALGITQVNDAHMADAIRVVAARKGLSLAECTLVACGGAGPVHAGFIADELGVARILVPFAPGVFSALGLLCSDVSHDYVQSVLEGADTLDPARLLSSFAELDEKARADLREDGFDTREIRYQREVDARYGGQGYEIRVPVDLAGSDDVLTRITEAFHAMHERLYGHAAPGERVEIVSCRLRAFVELQKYTPASAPAGCQLPGGLTGTREIRLGDQVVTAGIWLRTSLIPRQRLDGPAIVEQTDTTVVIPLGWTAEVDEFRNLILTRQPGTTDG